MACRISELVIDAADPDQLAAFWSKVLGYVELGREDDGSIEIGPPDAGTAMAASPASVTASGRVNASPPGSDFSTTMTTASAPIHARCATPTANINSMSAQQQPRQNRPWPTPSRRPPRRPRR